MTTPPTPAGWYPDPDGSGGQRYWDGFAWTEHRAPAAAPPPPVAPPPLAPPPPPAEPSGSGEEQTVVVPMRSAPTDEHVGAHRRPDPAAEPEPASEPDEVTQITERVAFSPDVPPAAPPPADFAPIPPPPPGPPPSAPSQFDYPSTPPPSAPSGNRKLVAGYAAACAALLAVLIGVIIYGFFIRDSSDVEISAGDTTTSEATTEAPTTTGDGGWGETSETETATDSPTTVAETGDATDGQLSFTVHGVEVGTTVVSSDAPIEKTAVGEYIVVHMTVTNVSPDPATFLGTFQKLLAGGTTYNIDDEATFYVGGGLAELPPGASADVSVAFDVPPGTQAEAIELHADPISPGVEVSLS